MGLSKVHRLKHWRDFKSVYHSGIRQGSRHLKMFALQESKIKKSQKLVGKSKVNSCLSPTQIGISISQKVSKKAVIRNRIKRQIRAGIQTLLPQIQPGWKIIIVVRPGTQKCEYEHFLRELKQLFTKIEVLNGNSRDHVL